LFLHGAGKPSEFEFLRQAPFIDRLDKADLFRCTLIAAAMMCSVSLSLFERAGMLEQELREKTETVRITRTQSGQMLQVPPFAPFSLFSSHTEP
jgi:hypothetical protein